MYDYLIIGGGLAGSTLGYRLIKQGAKVMVLDEPLKNISSLKAAGIFNPLTGKRTALTWEANALFAELHLFYSTMEKELNDLFFYPLPMYKLFESNFEQNEWLNKQNSIGFNSFMDSEIQHLDEKLIKNPFGALPILKAGRLDTVKFINAMHLWLQKQQALDFQPFNYEALQIKEDLVIYNDIKAEAVIFCDGANAYKNPFFNYLPHKPVHGEILEVQIPEFYQDRIINKGIYVLPISGQNYWIGATYNWDLKEPMVTQIGKEWLVAKLKEFIVGDFKIINHWAGLRPSTKDRRAFLGAHPQYKNLLMFGGFGSKGVSLIPYLSKVFTNYLLNDAEIPKEVDICRIQ